MYKIFSDISERGPDDSVNARVSHLINDYRRRVSTETVERIPKVNGIDGRLLILMNLKNLDCKQLAEYIIEEWDNEHLHNFIEDVFDVLLSYGKISKNPQEAYRYYLQVEDVLGAGVHGIVSAGLIGNCNTPFFAIKNSKTGDNFELAREFVVGRELSKLNNPVFTRLYALYNCSSVLNVGDSVDSYCQSGEQYSIGFQLLKGVPVRKSELTTEEFEIIFIIILSTLQQASQLGFTHYDLHSENVFVRKLDESLLVAVNIPGINISYVKTRYFPFILDYGFARIETNRGSIYCQGFEKYGILDEYVPMYDIYKFLFFTFYDHPDLNITHLVSPLERDIPLHNPNNYLRALKKKSEFFTVPNDLRKVSIEEYADSIREHIEKHDYQGPPTDYPLVGSYEPENFFETFGLLKKTKSTDDVTDSVLLDFGQKLEGNSLVKPINYLNLYNETLDQLSEELEALKPDMEHLDDEEFKRYYFNFTDELRNVFDGIYRLVERLEYERKKTNARKVNLSDKREIEMLKDKFNAVGKQFIPWDRRIKKMIEENKLVDIKSAIFKVRYIEEI